MLQSVHPKLPMRNKATTKAYYVDQLQFTDAGAADYPDYLILQKENIEIHFFHFAELDPQENYGQVYIRVKGIEAFYNELLDRNIAIHPNAPLQSKPWGLKEFSLLDPDNNLLTFGEPV
ncbi:bleomycin resistance protein [Flavihumibacter petaseus]|uniref:VOC domain-containing protein n=1 Tax=Flavihumibacter petaseus NBRC 106054 TaxID=1220578 RepID=A0A0E9MUP2_9BACT|nr:VOC family protein [Flavihumibacter petaseus]GAO41457.1 hypothetical protein FPE01S_01_04700 [Flavihumibacter petaseus NBRC 106054]